MLGQKNFFNFLNGLDKSFFVGYTNRTKSYGAYAKQGGKQKTLREKNAKA